MVASYRESSPLNRPMRSLSRRAQGATDSVARDQIATIAATGVSLMPEGLEKDLSHQDLANLIAFVRSIRAPVDNPTVPACDEIIEPGLRRSHAIER